MKKYNLSEIMKQAWTFVKKNGATMSEALKAAWAIAKSATAEIKERFCYKLAEQLGLPHHFYLDLFCGIKQTEKAVYAMCYTGYNASGSYATRKCAWIPKSCIVNLESLRFFDYDEAVARFTAEYAM